MTTLTLHKLPEGFIVTSDEKPEIGELYLDDTNSVRRSVMGSGTYWGNRNSYRKVIAQQDQIDLSTLSEEEQKKIGWFDVEKIQKEKFLKFRAMITEISEKNLFEIGIREGFQKAQELLSDKHKSWEIEVEMEYRDMMGMWGSRPTILEHLDRPSRPKLTNGKIKVTKIL
jgi:hypothetical protein